MIKKTTIALSLMGVLTMGQMAFSAPAWAGVNRVSQVRVPQTGVAQANTECDPSRFVQVSGTATVEVIPDQAFVRLTIFARNDSVEKAQSGVAATSQNVIKTLKAMGVTDKQINTDAFYTQPIYKNYDTRELAGFEVNYAMGVTISDSKKLNEVIAAAFKAGATGADQVEFRHTQIRKFRDEARVNAINAAKEKAALFAKAGNAELGCVLKIEEIRNDGYFPMANASQNNRTSVGQSESGDLPISLGVISARAEVQVTYSLK